MRKQSFPCEHAEFEVPMENPNERYHVSYMDTESGLQEREETDIKFEIKG